MQPHGNSKQYVCLNRIELWNALVWSPLVILIDAFESRQNIVSALDLHRQAQQVMDRLMQNRNTSQQYHKKAGHEDPLIVVTGQSAIDRAIDTTREIMQDLETSVDEPQKSTKFNTMCNGLSRLRSRLL